MRFSKRTRGFSLFEILLVVALVAILIDLAWPSWRHFLMSASSQTLLARLGAALKFARQEAQLRQAVVTVCGSRDQETCSDTWAAGLMVFIDSKQDGRVEAESQILQVFQLGRPAGALHWRAFPHNKESCQFLPSGASNHENGTFWYCYSAETEPAWALALSQSGRLRVSYPDKHGRLRDERGLPLPC